MLVDAAILLVEDDPVVARSCLRVLKRVRADAIHVSSCAAARALDRRCEVGIFDIDLGDGDGVALAAELLSSERVQRVVFFTSSADANRLREAHRLGDVVPKGAGEDHLKRAVLTAANPTSGWPSAAARFHDPQRRRR